MGSGVRVFVVDALCKGRALRGDLHLARVRRVPVAADQLIVRGHCAVVVMKVVGIDVRDQVIGLGRIGGIAVGGACRDVVQLFDGCLVIVQRQQALSHGEGRRRRHRCGGGLRPQGRERREQRA